MAHNTYNGLSFIDFHGTQRFQFFYNISKCRIADRW